MGARRMHALLRPLAPPDRSARGLFARRRDFRTGHRDQPGIGEHGIALIETIAATKKPGERVNVLTHCNAGWLATVDWGTATAADLSRA